MAKMERDYNFRKLKNTDPNFIHIFLINILIFVLAWSPLTYNYWAYNNKKYIYIYIWCLSQFVQNNSKTTVTWPPWCILAFQSHSTKVYFILFEIKVF